MLGSLVDCELVEVECAVPLHNGTQPAQGNLADGAACWIQPA